VNGPGPVGLLGGTFDPIHHAHLRLAHEAQVACGLDHVRFVPSATPPHRGTPGATAEQRLAMVELAIADHPGFVADRRELDRTQPSYTIHTLESLRIEFGADRPICLLLGADAFRLLETWHRWRDLFASAHLVVAHRPGFDPLPDTPALVDEYRRRRIDDPAALARQPAGCLLPLAITPLDISASAIRAERIAGGSPRYLLPDSVLGYIETHHLYRSVAAA
jgi:nicotinate-nucleotide adenylyltransferase